IYKTLMLVPVLWAKNVFTKNHFIKFSALISATILAGLSTFIFFIWAAGQAKGINWPMSFELYAMDQPFLWHISRTLIEHHQLLFSSSGQSFLFPEIPISLFSYIITTGNIYWYYIMVAVVNNSILFLLLFSLARKIFSEDGFSKQLTRAALAFVPLIGFMLVSSGTLVYLLHIAPNYNFDMYIGALIVPLIILSQSILGRTLWCVFYILIAASNMLTVIFSLPIIFIIGLLIFFKDSLLKALRFIAPFILLTILAFALNHFLFQTPHPSWSVSITSYNYQGQAYIDLDAMPERLKTVVNMLSEIKKGYWTSLISTAGILVAAVALLYYIKIFFKLRNRFKEPAMISRIYLLLWPFAGVATCYVLTLLYAWYCWPLMVGSVVVAILLITPSKYIYQVFSVFIAAAALLFLVIVSLHKGGFSVESRIEQAKSSYFNHRWSDTICTDNNIKSGSYIFANNSTGKVLTSQSQNNLRFLQMDPLYRPHGWLNNLREINYADSVHYIYMNSPDRGTKAQYTESALTKFGNPDKVIKCPSVGNMSGPGEIWIYNKNLKANR
ncbi:MAG: hypothetical protein WCF91_03505, partial [bacterium]